MPSVVVESLRKNYGKLKAVDGVSFQIEPGETFGLLGPNGAGKTTTIEILIGLRTRDGGHVEILGLDPGRETHGLKQRIGVQLQTDNLYPNLTVHELVDLFGSFFRRRLPADELVNLVNLDERRGALVKQLSGGQRQRLSLALALVNDPELIFLDEPTTGLDPQARRSLWELIGRFKGQGKTILLTTHYMEEAERLCDRVAVVDHGRVLAIDPPQNLIAQHFQEVAIQFSAPPRLDQTRLGDLTAVSSAADEDGLVTLYSADVPATLSALMALASSSGVVLNNLEVRRATLEDVFLKLTGRRIRE
ncbi:MAG: ABC transporter ATP-binding protein [Chloroflexota bacterium]|nr:MAG: ABC transporter ATP-binding protein [Chloroflexota bacterium]